MLQVEDVTKRFVRRDGTVTALDHVSFSVAAGEFVAVQGASGSGKTTLLLAVGAMLAPDAGSVSLDGRSVYAMPREQRARFRAKSIGFVFQQFHLLPYLSVFENVLTPTLATRVPDAKDRALSLLRRFNMEGRMSHRPAALSTGERQRTALVRALLAEPQIILADEPTGNLDEGNAELVLTALTEYAEQGGAVLLVTHSRDAAGKAQRIVQLEAGAISEG